MKLLVDSDFFIALYKSDDSNHKAADAILKKVFNQDRLMILDLVIQESVTVISKRMGMDDARIFYKSILQIVNQAIKADDELVDSTWKIFLKQTKKGSSFIDCANLAAIEKYKLDGILSFDKFYPKSLTKSI